jgi:hypothetical protein
MIWLVHGGIGFLRNDATYIYQAIWCRIAYLCIKEHLQNKLSQVSPVCILIHFSIPILILCLLLRIVISRAAGGGIFFFLLTEWSLMDPLGRLRNNFQVYFWGLTQNILYEERLQYQSWKYAEGAGVSRSKMCRSVPEENVPECPGGKCAGVSTSATVTLVYIWYWGGAVWNNGGFWVWSCEAIGRNLYYCPIGALRWTPMSRWHHSFTRVFHLFWHQQVITKRWC